MRVNHSSVLRRLAAAAASGHRRYRRMLAAVAFGSLASLSHAQPFPSQSIAIVVPYPPGASADQVARLVAPKLSASIGQPVIVEYKAGANGSVGAAYVAKSPPDGYRILMATQPILGINAHVQKDTGFDPIKDLTPLTKAVNAVVALGVHPSLPVKSMAELIDYAKKNPGSLTYGTAGAGSPQHIGGVLLSQRAQIETTHVPYKGGGPMVADLLAGHIKAGIATLAALKPYMGGRIRIIAVGEAGRFPTAPEIPTMAETLAGFELTTWLGFFGPAGLPPNLVAVLSGELAKALRTDDVRTKLQDAALLVSPDGPEALARVVREDYELYGRIIREHRIAVD
jgi:tripartite-type tricarboxylate transporter receptor subunit TctC